MLEKSVVKNYNSAILRIRLKINLVQECCFLLFLLCTSIFESFSPPTSGGFSLRSYANIFDTGTRMSHKIKNKYLKLGLDIRDFLRKISGSKYEFVDLISYSVETHDPRDICILNKVCYRIQISDYCYRLGVIEYIEERLNEFAHPCVDGKLFLINTSLKFWSNPYTDPDLVLDIETKL
ncbi:hypothetical protein BGI40_01550 [Snodgrassella communis]|nr:hypothetical protein BGI29_01750 [Snodgrassella communis]PIT28171.1 hypothetical protein BGI38_05125 [Snodgrassella communis]PIT30389.1 hypothetical protein BGI39_00550 [Snodgrassella communis]PIT37097.1 hypothetical protein BGI40_01550 [Snodgrassella communis]